MADRLPAPFSSAPVVAIASWLVPGSGYLLIGQWSRGFTIGLTILGLYLAGLLVSGVRVLEVPGYTDHGERKLYRFVVQAPTPNSRGKYDQGWVLQVAPIAELRDKPWSVPQIMAGPIDIAASVASVWASKPDPDSGENQVRFKRGLQGNLTPQNPQGPAYKGIGGVTHARMPDIGSLYLSVAGLLNLMAIIDAAHRATKQPARSEEDPA